MMAGKKEVWTPKLCIEGEKSSLLLSGHSQSADDDVGSH